MGKIKLKAKQLEYGDAVVIVGAGAAGIAAAISAARLRKNIFLIEGTAKLGGTVTQTLIHTLGGFYDSSGEFINKGLCVELVNRLLQASPLTRMRKIGRIWTLSVCPEVYTNVVESWLREESNIKIFCNSRVTRIVTEDRRVRSIEFMSPEGMITVRPSALIDTTGNAAVVRLFDHRLIVDARRELAAGLIFQIRGVKSEMLKFPKNIELVRAIQQAAEKGILPRQCALVWVDIGVYENEAYVKLSVSLNGNWRSPGELEKVTQRALVIRDKLVSFLKRLPSFSEATVTRTGKLGIRGGDMVKGEYCLTEEDVRSGRKFPDPACRCCWPIEYWDPDTGISLEYLPVDTYYEIPLRSLKIQSIENLWVAGKSFSAEIRAQASARVVGSCWSMGEAVAKAAVRH